MIVRLFVEEGMWVAQMLEHDIRAQGSSPGEALYRHGLTVQAYESMGDLSAIPPAPDYYWELP